MRAVKPTRRKRNEEPVDVQIDEDLGEDFLGKAREPSIQYRWQEQLSRWTTRQAARPYVEPTCAWIAFGFCRMFSEELRLTGPEQSVLRRVAERMPECFAGVVTLAAETGYSEPTVKRATARLQRLGILNVENRRNEKGRHQSNRYTLSFLEGVYLKTKRGKASRE